MDFSRLKELIRVWAPVVGLVVAAWNAYDFYIGFQKDDGSPFRAKQLQLATLKKENVVLEKKVKELDEFVRQIEAKKSEVSELVQKLEETKGAIADEIQGPDFMKLLVTEAKRVGLTVLAITPARKAQKEYYLEFPVELKFRGVYAQVYSFLTRLANLQRIVRVDRFEMKPVTSSAAKFVELEGMLELKTFSYLGSKADQIGKEAK